MSTPRLGIDFGTSQIKATRMTTSGKTLSIETIPTPTNSRNNRFTHPPKLLLKRAQQIPERFGLNGEWEAAIASQRSTFILWKADSGKRLTPLISWRDRRGSNWINNLSDRQVRKITEVTGIRPEAGYPLAKLKGLLEDNPRLRKMAENGEVNYGSLDTWLLWEATNGNHYQMVPTQASRTLLFDPVENEWDQDLLREFDIPAALFPPVRDSFQDRIDAGNLWENCEIVSLIGDQPAATIGGQPPPYTQTRTTLGTAGFVSDPCEPEHCPEGLTVGFTPTRTDRVFQAEGVVLSAGKAVDWLIRVLGINHSTFENWLNPPWPEDVPLWCPSLNGVGAPYWKNRKGTLDFLTESVSTREIALGLVVSILQRVRDILERLPERSNRRVLLDGGMSSFNHVPPLAAAIWGLPTAETLNPHLTCRGSLIASHWRDSYFTGDPWKHLNVEVTVPEGNAPTHTWNERWDRALVGWGLEDE